MARPVELTRAEFDALERRRRGLDAAPAATRAAASKRRATGEAFEQRILRACELYAELGLGYVERFEPKRIFVRGKPRWIGRGRPDWIGALGGWAVLFDTKDVTGVASYRHDITDDGQRKQLEALLRWLHVGGPSARAFLLLHDRELRVAGHEPGAVWLLEGRARLEALRAGERVPIRSLTRAAAGRPQVITHHLPVIGPSPTADVARRIRPAWDLLALLRAGRREAGEE